MQLFAYTSFKLYVVTVDWMIADMLAIRQGSIGHLRYVLKDSLKYLPFYGAYFRQVSRHYSCVSCQNNMLICSVVAQHTRSMIVTYHEYSLVHKMLKTIKTFVVRTRHQRHLTYGHT